MQERMREKSEKNTGKNSSGRIVLTGHLTHYTWDEMRSLWLKNREPGFPQEVLLFSYSEFTGGFTRTARETSTEF